MTDDNDWTDDYGTLKPGDVFKWEGIDGGHKVVSVFKTNGGGMGMGEYPTTYTIMLDDFDRFTIDTWASGKYRRFRVVGTGHSPSQTTERYLADKWQKQTDGNNETRPGTKRAQSGPHATISLADHTFAPDYPESFQNGPLALQDALNTNRADRDSGQFLEVRQSDLWQTLDRLARAEQSVADKIERFHEKEPEAWAGSDAYRDLKDAIVASQIGALEHCKESSDAAGLPWTMSGLQSIAAGSIIGDLVALGWLPPKPDIRYGIGDAE